MSAMVAKNFWLSVFNFVIKAFNSSFVKFRGYSSCDYKGYPPILESIIIN